MNPTVPSLGTLRVSQHLIPAHKGLPNSSPHNKPLLIYHGVFSVSASAVVVEAHLTAVGVVASQWRYTMYSTTHFHSSSHEILCVAAGRARLCFGGEENPGRVELVVEASDVMVLPAGMAHRLLEDLSGGVGGGFEMVGSYPKGCQWDMCYGKAGEEGKVEGIGKLPWFDRDPVYGDRGPVLDV